MKVDVKINQLMRRLTFISIALTFFIFVLQLNYPPQLFLQWISAFIFIRLSWYLISVLQFAGESVSVQNPFSILLGINIVSFFSIIFPVSELALPFGALNILLSIYVFYISFHIKNQAFAKGFKIYGLSLIIIIASKLILIFLIPPVKLPEHSRYLCLITLTELFPLYAILSIIKRVNLTLHEKDTSVLISEIAP